jgi:transcriptional regulator with XRE-family HTH domain
LKANGVRLPLTLRVSRGWPGGPAASILEAFEEDAPIPDGVEKPAPDIVSGPMENKDEVARISKLLESLLNLRKVGLSKMARHLGFSGGNLRRILDGRVELKYRMILDILTYLGIPPLTFFQIAYEGQDETAEALAGRLERIRPSGQAPELPQVDHFSKDELRNLVRETLGELGVLAMLDKVPKSASPRKESSATMPPPSPAASPSSKRRRRPAPAKDGQ